MAELTRGQEEERQQASAVAAGLPPTPPSPYEEAAKFKAEQEAKPEREKQKALAEITDLQKLTPEQYKAYQSLTPAEQLEIAKRTGAVEADVVATKGGYVRQSDIDNYIQSLQSAGAITADYADKIRQMSPDLAITTLDIRARQLGDVQKADVLTTYGKLTGASIEELKKMSAEIEEKGLPAVTQYVQQLQTKAIQERENEIAKFETEELPEFPAEVQEAYKTGGFTELKKAVDAYNTRIAADQPKIIGIAEKVPYVEQFREEFTSQPDMFKEGIIYEALFNKPYLRDKSFEELSPTDQEQVLGYYLSGQGDEGLVQAAAMGYVPMEAAILATADGAKIAAGFVPILGTIVYWNEMEPWEKALSISLDALDIAALGAYTLTGARAATGVGKLARLKGAAEGAKAAVVAELTAPIQTILHPVETVKAGARGSRELFENVFRPGKIPEAVLTTTYSTVRIPLSQLDNPTDALRARNTLMELAAIGDNPVIELNGVKYHLSRSALMQELGGGLVHTTPGGEAFASGMKVNVKPNLPEIEQGLFLSHEPLPRFTTSSAFGKTGSKPAIVIMSPDIAMQAIDTGKIYKSPLGAVAELERKLPIDFVIDAPTQRLMTRIGSQGTKVDILLVGAKLSPVQIAKLKGLAIIETLKAPFSPALTISGRGLEAIEGSLDMAGVDDMARVLREAGYADIADTLTGAARVAMRGDVADISYRGDLVSVGEVRGTDIQGNPITDMLEIRAEGELIEPVRVGADRINRVAITDGRMSILRENPTAMQQVGIDRVDTVREAVRNSVIQERGRVEIGREPILSRAISPVYEPIRGRPEQPVDKTRRIPPVDDRRIPPGITEIRGGNRRLPDETIDRIPPRRPPTREEPPRIPPDRPPTRKPPDREPPPERPPRRPPPDEPISTIPIGQRGMPLTEEKRRTTIPSGSVTWAQGLFWKYIPPPFDVRKPITLSKGVVPDGAINTSSNIPEETVQVIGKSDTEVPNTMSVDMGRVDVEIYNKGQAIRYIRDSNTNVGTRINDPYKGLSIPSEILEPLPLRKYKKPKTKHKAKKNDFSDLVSMQGVRL